jgi:type II secretory pathway component PulC
MHPARTSLTTLLLLGGCATAHHSPDPPPTATLASEPAAPTPPQATAAAPGRAPGTILRGELEAVLGRSPGMFLQHVDSEPRYRAGRFAGWTLVRFFPGDPQFATVDLRAGDVVLSVNGSSVERPEQLMELWQALHVSKELVVELERAGQPRTLRWTIMP